MKVLTVVGARPQFIKAAPVSKALERMGIEEVLVDTGQHYDERLTNRIQTDVGMRTPDISLGVGSGTHAIQSAHMMSSLEPVMHDVKPDAVVVYGDTNSTLAAALVAAKLHIPIAHVEAGLRSFNRRMPEEINRKLVDHVSTWLFCTSELAAKQLCCEGISTGVHTVGDVMRDATDRFADAARHEIDLSKFGVEPGAFAVATLHRAENTDDRDRLQTLVDLIGSWTDPVVLPAHPRLTHALCSAGVSLPKNIRVTPPVSYLEMLALVQQATHVLTDSGGLQKEAFWMRTPCITLRNETEWVETVRLGWNHVVGADAVAFAAAAASPRPADADPDAYGDGHASERIARILKAEIPCAASTAN